MAREWTERHIRELIARSGGGGSGEPAQGFFSCSVPAIGMYPTMSFENSNFWAFVPLPLTAPTETQNYDFMASVGLTNLEMNARSHPRGIWIGRIDNGNSLFPRAWNYYGGRIPSDLDVDGNIQPQTAAEITNIVAIVPMQYVPLRTPAGDRYPICTVFPGCMASRYKSGDNIPAPVLTYTMHRLRNNSTGGLDMYEYMPDPSAAEALLQTLQSNTVSGGDISVKIYTASAIPQTSQGAPYVQAQGRRGTAAATVNDVFAPLAVSNVNGVPSSDGYLYTRSILSDVHTPIYVAPASMALIASDQIATAGYYWMEVNHFTTVDPNYGWFPS